MPETDKTTATSDRSAGSSRARLQHVVVHYESSGIFDDVLVFGTELDALRHLVGTQDWEYIAVGHGQSVAEALKAARS